MSHAWHHATAVRVHEHGHPVCSPYRHAVPGGHALVQVRAHARHAMHGEGPAHATRHQHGGHRMLLPHVGRLVALVVTRRCAVRGTGGWDGSCWRLVGRQSRWRPWRAVGHRGHAFCVPALPLARCLGLLVPEGECRTWQGGGLSGHRPSLLRLLLMRVGGGLLPASRRQMFVDCLCSHILPLGGHRQRLGLGLRQLGWLGV